VLLEWSRVEFFVVDMTISGVEQTVTVKSYYRLLQKWTLPLLIQLYSRLSWLRAKNSTRKILSNFGTHL